MHIIQCSNGHFFDNDKYQVCPHCGASTTASETPKKKEKSDSIFRRKPKTEPSTGSHKTTGIFHSSNTPESVEPEDDRTMILPPGYEDSDITKSDMLQGSGTPVSAPAPMPAPIPAPMPQPVQPIATPVQPMSIPAQPVQPMAPVQPMSQPMPSPAPSEGGKTLGFFRSSNTQVTKEPVVGWLVCVKGKHFGECFEIISGRNSVGRNPDNRIVIADDPSVSGSKHFWVTYEPKKREFYVQPGESSGLSYLNGETIMTPQKLQAYDQLEFGMGVYVMIPLCSEKFSWEDYLE